MKSIPTVEARLYGQPEDVKGGAGTHRQVSPSPHIAPLPKPKGWGRM